jgi:1-deoxy-D-xylulose-5-phosphate synthase
MAPSDENELRRMLHTALTIDGASAFRFPRGGGEGVALDPEPAALEVGKGRLARAVPGQPDVCVVALGSTVRPALAAAEALAAEGIAASVIDARFVKPLDEELVAAEAARARRVVTVEEGCLPGGFGSAVLEGLERRGLVAEGIRVRRLGLPDAFVTHGDPAKQRAELGIDKDGIARACRELAGDRRARGVA